MPKGRVAPAPPCRTLAQYIRELLRVVRAADHPAFARLLMLVGDRRASIVMGSERALMSARDGRVSVRASTAPYRGPNLGLTSRRTVLRLLDGYVEVSAALLGGELEMTGTIDDVGRMAMAIEIILDVSARSPELQRLARDFRADPCHPVERELWRDAPRRPSLTSSSPAELVLLARLGLLDGASASAEPA